MTTDFEWKMEIDHVSRCVIFADDDGTESISFDEMHQEPDTPRKYLMRFIIPRSVFVVEVPEGNE